MIEHIIGATVVPILQNLAWTDQIGWMVKPWTKSVQTGDEQFKEIIYPVASNVTVEGCDVNPLSLKVLTTDKGYTSLILIKAVGDGPITPAENIPKRRAVNIDQTFSISVWMNDHQATTHLAKAEILKHLYRVVFRNQAISWFRGGVADEDYDIYINKLKINLVSEIEGNPFSEYSFSSDQAQFANNYSAFGFTFKMTGLIFPACIPAYPDLEHGPCEDDYECEFTAAAVADVAEVCSGSGTTLTATVTGGYGDITYQWQKLIGATWTNIALATEAEYETEDLTGAEGTIHSFRVGATRNGCTNYSDAVEITVQDQPEVVIFSEITGITLAEETTIESEVTGGIGGNSYQWQHNNASVWTNIPGKTSASYAFFGSAWGVGDHEFRLHVTQDPGCEAFSDPIEITITP